MLAPDVLAQPTGGTIDGAAQGSGQTVLTGLSSVFSGNLALAAGLGLAFFGFWMWAVQQQSWGIVILICGVIITAFPGIFEGMTKGASSIANAFCWGRWYSCH